MKTGRMLLVFGVLVLSGVPSFICAAGNHDRKESTKPQASTASVVPGIAEKSYAIDVAGQPASFIGTVSLYGNDPHLWTGVTPEKSNDVYRVAQPEAAMDLRAVQGYRIQFTGVLRTHSSGRLPGSGDADLFVTYWRIVQ